MIDLANLAEKIQNFKIQAAGFIGESVFENLARTYLGDDYHIACDVVLKAHTGTTQIDQIIVSKFGIFVVEVKTYKGWIWGNQRDARWTQTLYGEKNSFQNPLRQNYKHIKSLQNILTFPDSTFKSIIVFSAEAQFRTEMPSNVVRGGEDYIRFIKKHQSVILSDDDISESVRKISDNRLSSAEHQAHMQKTRQQYEKADRNNPPDCPRCGKNMVLRKSKKGYYTGRDFWGCSGYPECKTIVGIKSDNEKVNEKIKIIEKTFNFLFE
jgi:hypothetical protein